MAKTTKTDPVLKKPLKKTVADDSELNLAEPRSEKDKRAGIFRVKHVPYGSFFSEDGRPGSVFYRLPNQYSLRQTRALDQVDTVYRDEAGAAQLVSFFHDRVISKLLPPEPPEPELKLSEVPVGAFFEFSVKMAGTAKYLRLPDDFKYGSTGVPCVGLGRNSVTYFPGDHTVRLFKKAN